MARTQNARITLTLSGVATVEELQEMEDRIMSALTDAVATMRTAVEGVAGRLGDPGALEAAVAAERARYDALVADEATEDIAQDAELQAARAEVDRLVGEQTAAAGDLMQLADQLNSVGTAVDEAPPGTPVDEVDVPDVSVPSPDSEVQTPDEAPAEPAPDAPVDVPEEDVAPVDDAAPAPDAPAEPAPDAPAPDDGGDGGPTDSDGNPVVAPTL